MDGNYKHRKTMKKRILYYIWMACAAVLLHSCEDVETHKPYGDGSGHAPGTVQVTSYEQIPGGVTLKFIAPTDEDLLYIKIKYTLDNGKEMEARASLYTDETTIEGFGNTNPKKLVISAVNKMEKEGEAIIAEIVPGKPAYLTAIEEIEVNPTFGGIYIHTTNGGRNYLIFDVSTKDSKGNWNIEHTEYTSVKNIGFTLRGFSAEPHDFKVRVRDLYDNQSEEYLTTLTPLYEEKLDLTKFKTFYLANDIKMDNAGHTLESLFNGDHGLNSWNYAHGYDFNPSEFPVWFTFDMGQTAQLSRFTSWQRSMGGSYYYRAGAIKEWEVWGRSDLPSSDGSWDGWTKLADCESIKPSGWPAGSNSEEDITYASKGEEFEFPADIPPVRYIRFKILSTHDGAGLVVMQQLWFYGTPIQ